MFLDANMHFILKLFWLCILVHRSLVSGYTSSVNSSCHCIPGDDCWPSLSEWADLNSSVHGRLIATESLAAPCHLPTFNATTCSVLKTKWDIAGLHYNSSSSPMAGVIQNASCDPFTPASDLCVLGNIVSYSINVTSAEDVAAGLKFSEEKNVRLVIRNTGHDYWGKSSGKGGLAIWTHNLKSTEFVNYSSSGYTGPAAKFGAGVQGYEAFIAAHAHGLRVLSGTCVTVGLVGGYTQGGGHSALGSLYGLAADQTLEWEVVTAEGNLVRAAPDENADLYWALSGGGGGTYGVVLSLVVKAFPDDIAGGASFRMNSSGVSQDTWWKVIENWHTYVPKILDGGATLDWDTTAEYLSIFPVFSSGSNESAMLEILRPFTSYLDRMNMTYALQVTSFPSYLQHVEYWLGPLPDGSFPIQQVTGGRLVPRSVIETNNAGFTAVVRNITSDPKFLIGHVALNVAHSVAGNLPGSNAVLPAWRDALFLVIISGAWDFQDSLEANLAVERKLTESVTPMMNAVTPGSGTYLNEGDINQAGWKEAFYGVNYERLLSIKKKWDPRDLFYAKTAVGSDAWAVDGVGRLCRA